MSFSVRLTRSGLRHETHRDGETVVRIHAPTSVPELLRFWHYLLDGVDEDVTLGDLFRMLRDVDGIHALSGMLSCDVDAFLEEAARPTDAPARDVDYLVITNTAWVERDEDTPRYHLTRDMSGYGPWQEPCAGAWSDEDEPRCGHIGVDFCPVNEIVHLPLRYEPGVSFARERYGESVLDAELTITFGAFVHAVFWEIGFYGEPARRDVQGALLRESVAEIERGEAKTTSIEELFRELDESKDEEDMP